MQNPNLGGSAIVLGGNVNALGVVRSLGRLGVRCGTLFVPEPDDYSRHSRYVSVSEPVARDASDRELRLTLDRVAEALRADHPVLIATSDRFSQFLSANQAYIGKDYIINCPTIDLADLFLDKWKTALICNEHGVRIPPTWCPMNSDELQKCAGSVRYPVIIKPRYTFSEKFPGKNVVAQNKEDLIHFYKLYDLIGRTVVQNVIPSGDGDIFAIASYSDSYGKVRASVCWRKIRQHYPDFGATCFGISENHASLEKENKEFLEAIGYRGFSMSEFARSREDSESYFLELNTRTSWPNQLFADVGVDLTRLAYLDMSGQDLEQVSDLNPREGVVWLDLRRDRSAMRMKRQQGTISYWQWLRSLTQARSFAHWNWRDPVPFFMITLYHRIKR